MSIEQGIKELLAEKISEELERREAEEKAAIARAKKKEWIRFGLFVATLLAVTAGCIYYLVAG